MPEIIYYPEFFDELDGILAYIKDNLENPAASARLREAVDAAISNLPVFPLAHRRFRPFDDLEFEFRILPVKNYYVFYSVDEKSNIKIHHIYYNKRDFLKLIK
jgi:plasmid stabilization system protein ParE